jgi:ornithine cyclodeaminase
VRRLAGRADPLPRRGSPRRVRASGPPQVGRAEFPLDLVARADVAVTDSLAQVPAYDPPNVLAETPHAQRLTLLGAILAGDARGRTSHDQVILFCSVGPAGTETYLLDRLCRTGLIHETVRDH